MLRYAMSAVALTLAACQSAPTPVPMETGEELFPDEAIAAAVLQANVPRERLSFDPTLIAEGLGVEEQRLIDLQQIWRARMDVALHNLQNVQTPGFKRRTLHTASVPVVAPAPISDATRPAVDATTPTARSWIGGGAVVAEVRAVFTQGSLQVTERPLDLAIDGDGFFEVVDARGESFYTRDGAFHINADAVLCTGSGAIVQPQITFPEDVLDVNINECGQVLGRTGGAPDTTTLFGQLLINRFVDPGGLEDVGDICWRRTDASGPPTQGAPGTAMLGHVLQGFVERSNVELATELVRLNTARQQFEALARVLGI